MSNQIFDSAISTLRDTFAKCSDEIVRLQALEATIHKQAETARAVLDAAEVQRRQLLAGARVQAGEMLELARKQSEAKATQEHVN